MRAIRFPNCGGKTSLEGNNLSSICCAALLVHFLTMASTAGCEIMNSEVSGSILTVFTRKRKSKKGIFSRQKPAKLNHLKTAMRAIYRTVASHSNTEKVALDPGYLIGVPAIIWKYVRFSGGECSGETGLEGNNSSSICCATLFCLLPHNTQYSKAATKQQSTSSCVVVPLQQYVPDK